MPKSKYDKEQLEIIVDNSKSWAEVCRAVGVKPFTGAQTYIKKVCNEFQINHSHFTGKGWLKGKTYQKYNLDDYLNNIQAINSHKLKLILIKEGLKEEKCEKCNMTEWLGDKIPLELDHMDSNHLNNNLSNLQIVCPNCHTLETRKRRITGM